MKNKLVLVTLLAGFHSVSYAGNIIGLKPAASVMGKLQDTITKVHNLVTYLNDPEVQKSLDAHIRNEIDSRRGVAPVENNETEHAKKAQALIDEILADCRDLLSRETFVSIFSNNNSYAEALKNFAHMMQ